MGLYYGTVSCSSENTNIAECSATQEEVTIEGKAPGTINITVIEDAKNIEVTYTVAVKEFKGNTPVLVAGMQPVKWNASNVESNTTESDPEWNDYSQKKRANVKTVDGHIGYGYQDMHIR